MEKEKLENLVKKIKECMDEIGVIPQGRELALMKTHLETAELWSTKVKTID